MERFVRSMIIMTMLLAGLAAGAQAQQQAPGPQGGASGADRPIEQQREEVRKKVEAVRLARMTEALQLDEKTAAKFIPAITAIERKRRALMKENQETTRELKIMLHANPPDEAKLKAAISAIEKNRHEISSLREKEFNAAKDNLTATQMARYLLFNQEFQKEMRGMVEGARHPRRGGPGKGGGPAPQRP
jgi:Spy/CpxP family protein refolding chaperone